MKANTPFYKRVPKEIEANLRYRQKLIQAVIDDPSYADVLWDACSKDILFYINAFVWTYDPRREPYTKLPLITYGFQDEGILEIVRAIGSHDLLIEKSRDMGASWICVVVPEWSWHFLPLQSFLFVSRTEDYVDKNDNPKSLMWKVDFMHRNMPPWLLPPGYHPDNKSCRTSLHIKNPHNGSVIDGESTTGRVARGDRRTAILLDEFAAVEQGRAVLSSTRDATNSRLFNSTPEGTGNAYYEMSLTDIKKLRFHWSAHPLKNRGLYTTGTDGELVVLIPDGYPENYQPILDGKLRSPWYDGECKRVASPKEIAQELDIDYLGSGWQFFSADAVQKAVTQFARPAVTVGHLEYDGATAEPIRFREEDRGNLSLWCLLDRENNIPTEHRMTLAADISAGTGASNSCLAGWDVVTKEKVLEYVNPYVRPEEFARQAVAMARWMGNAFLIWENNGPGRQFGSRVIELGYSNIYYRKNDESITKKVSDVPGWASTKETKLVLMGDYRSAIEKAVCVNRSRLALEECLEYIHDPQGGVSHARANDKDDPSGAKSNHGDRAIADALAWKGIGEWSMKRRDQDKPEVPHGSLAWRRKMQDEVKRSKQDDKLGDGWL